MYIVFYFVLNECDPTVIVANVRDFPASSSFVITN